MSKIDNENVKNIISNADSNGREERNVPDLRFDFDQHYRTSTIKKLFTVLSNNSLSRENLNNISGELKNIHYGDILTKLPTVLTDESGIPFINSEISVPSNSLVKIGDIILSDTAEDYTVGKTIEINFISDATISSGLHTIPLRPIQKFSHGFLGYYFNSTRFKKKLYPLIQGIKVYSISKTALLGVEISYPSTNEQTKIATFLMLIDNRIQTQKKIIELHKSLIISIKNREFYNSKRSNCKLENVLVEINKKTVIKNQHEILSSTVKGIVKQSDYFDRQVASENNVGYKIVERGNVIISPQNLWMGNISYNDKFDIGIVSPSYRIFSINSEFNSQYIFEMLSTKKSLYLFKTVSEQGASIVRRNLNYEAFLQLTFHIPNINHQNTFIERLVSLQNKLSIEKQILELLEKQKQYLLQKLFI